MPEIIYDRAPFGGINVMFIPHDVSMGVYMDRLCFDNGKHGRIVRHPNVFDCGLNLNGALHDASRLYRDRIRRS